MRIGGAVVHRWAAIVAVGTMVFAGMVAVDAVNAPMASAVTNIPVPGGVQAQMNGHVGYNGPNPSTANATTDDDYRYGSASTTTNSGTISNSGGSAGTAGQSYSNGYTAFVNSGNTAWTAHGDESGSGGSLDLSEQSALGFAPANLSSVNTGTIFNLGRMAHKNNPVSVENDWYQGDLKIKFLSMELTYRWQMNETSNRCFPTGCSDDYTNFLNQISSQTFVAADGLTYTLVVQGFVAPQSGTTCNATVPSIGSVINQFRTVEGQTTYGCLYASVEQVREVTINKVVSSPYTTAPAKTFNFTNSSTLAGSAWDAPFNLTNGQSVTRNYNSGEAITVTEAAQTAPWAFTSIACVDGTGDAIPGITTSGTSLTIPRGTTAATAAASKITCTYTNTYTPTAQITLVKQVTSTGQQGTVAVPADWQLSALGQGVVSTQTVAGPGNSPAVTNQTVIAGTYQLTEVATNAATTGGYAQDGPWACTGGITPNASGQITLTHGQSTTCTVRNVFQTGSLEITKTVNAPAGGYTQGAAKAFTAQYSCVVPGGATIVNTITVNPAATNGNAGAVATISNLPAGSDCTVTELNAPTGTSTDLANGSFVWGAPTATPGAAVEIPVNAAVRVNLTNPVTQNTGSLTINKVVTPRAGVPAAGYTGSGAATPRTFEIDYACSIGGTTTASGTRNIAAGQSATITGIPATSTCVISEDAQTVVAGDFFDASYTWDGSTITQPTVITTNGTSTGTVTNFYTRQLATLTIAKVVTGGGYTAGDTFTIDYACGSGDSAVNGSVVLAGGASQTVQVPSGVSCTVDETADRPALSGGYIWQDPSYAGLTNGSVTATLAAPATVTVTNPTAIGFNRISVSKQIANFASQVSAGTEFEVTVACDQPAQGQVGNYTDVFTFTTPLSSAQQTPFLPIGTSCTVVETALPTGSQNLPGSSYAWSATPTYQGLTDGAIVVTESTTPASATVVNDINRVYGALSINKTVVNNTGATLTAGYSGTWTCNFGGELHAGGTWTAPAGGGTATLTTTAGGGTHTQLLVGSICSVDELDPVNPVAGDNSYVWGTVLPAEILPVSADGTSATVTNTLDRTTGSFSVTKSVTGGAAPAQFANTAFNFDYSCTPPSGPVISGTLNVMPGTSVGGPAGIPAGSVCDVSEQMDALPVPVDPYRWDGVTFSVAGAAGTDITDGIRFTTPADGATVAVTATNSISQRMGSVTVLKEVTPLEDGFTGGSDEIFPMTLTCTDPATGDSAQVGQSQTIANGATATWNNIPIGVICTVQEGGFTAGLKDSSFAWNAPTYSHGAGVTVAETNTPQMTVTNSMRRVYGEISIAKYFDNAGFTGVVPNDRIYTGEWSCSYDGDVVAAGTWSGTGSSGGTSATLTATTGSASQIFLTSSCTVTEDPLAAPSATDSSFYWLDPVLVGETSVAATAGDNWMTVTNTLARNTGSVTVAKTLSGEEDGYVGTGFAGFPVGIACALNPDDIDNVNAERMTGSVMVMPDAAAVTLITGVPTGWTCGVSEGAFTGGLYDASYAWGDATITIDGATATRVVIDATEAAVVVDNPITRLTGGIDITKAIPAELQFAVNSGATFSGAYSCVYEEGTAREETFSGTWTRTDTGAATITGDTVMPYGTICEVTETAPNDATLVDASWSWGTPVVTPATAAVTANGPASFTVTNTPERVYGTLQINKQLEGPTTGFSNPNLTVTGAWTCEYNDVQVATGTWEAPATGGAATLSPADAVASIPVTSECRAVEDTLDTEVFIDESYVWGAQPEVQVADPITAGEPSSITFVNTVERVYGTYAITKAITRGDGVADTAPSTGITYSGEYVCEYGGVEDAPKPWSMIGASTFTAPDPYYVGTECWVASETTPSAPVPGDDSFQWTGSTLGAPATLAPNPAVGSSTVTNSLIRVVGDFTVTKSLEGDTSGLLEADSLYSFEWQCVAGNGDLFPANGEPGTFAIAATASWNPLDDDIDIPIGSECTVTETNRPALNDPSYTWSTAMSITGTTGNASDMTMTFTTPADDDPPVIVIATNTITRDMGSYTVMKESDPASGSTVEPGDTITYTVTVTPSETGFVDNVVVTDDLSAVLPFATLDTTSITASAGSAAVSGNSLVWTIGRVNVGDPLTLTYTVTVDAGQWGVTLRNSVSTTGENPPEECTQCSTVHYTPAWSVMKTADPASGSVVVAGDTITYTLTAENTTENATVSGASAIDNLADVLAYADLQPLPAGLTNSDGVLTWAIPTLLPGQTADISYSVVVKDGFDGVTLANSVQPGPGGDCVENCTTTHLTPAWTLEKSSDPASGSTVLAGEEVTYTLTITNTGEAVVPTATASDDLSNVLAHADIVGDLPAGLTLTGTTLTWNAGAIAVDDSVSISYTVKVHDDARGVTLRNVVVPTSPGGDCVESCTTQHPVPAWSLTKSSDPASGTTVLPGEEVTYTLTATNTGPVAVDGLTAIDDLSGVLAHADIVGDLPAGLTLDGTTLTWNIGELDVEETASISYTVVVHDDAPGTTLRNVVVPGGPGGECVDSCVTEHPVPSWTLSKSSDPASGSTVQAGDEVTYTLTVANTGPAATSVVATDNLSDVLAHADIVGDLPAGLTLDGTTLTWNAGVVGVEETVSISYTVKVHDDARGVTLRNVVVPTSPGGECVDSCVTEHPVPAWTLSKSSDPASGTSVLPGEEITYTLTIENTGPVVVESATAVDNLADVLAHADLVGDLPAGLVLDGTTLTWTTGAIAVGESASVSYTVVVHDDARGATLRNVVVPTGPGVCEGSCTTENLVPAWTLTKTSDPASGSTVKPGDKVTYTLTATNIGDVTLTGALAVDDMSDVLDHATLAENLPASLTLNGDVLTWAVPDLEPGATATVSYIVTVKADAKGVTIKNVVTPAGTPGGDCVDSCSTTHKVPTPPKPLPATGTSNALPWGIAGGFALIVGAVLLLVRRNRRELQD